ncbi:MAG: glycosyltransferase family 4 protein [Planctomycetales bacterium]|nr:glycosyltransferase family 4 protein [Planctomycetales bacterium]
MGDGKLLTEDVAGERRLTVVHLPFYSENPYQPLLMQAQRELGLNVREGGGGGNFLRSALFRWKADVIHFHWLHPYMIRPTAIGTFVRSLRFLVELLLLRLAGKRLIWTMHNEGNHDRRHPHLEKFFRSLIIPVFHQVVVHSEFARQRFAYHFGQSRNVSVYPHPWYENAYPDTISRQEARAALGLAEEETVFLFLGRILAYKGVLQLIDAFRSMPQRSLRLVIAGGIGDKAELARVQEAAQGDARILMHPSYVPAEKMQVYFKSADAVVFPFRDILTSGSVVLAMGFARAVIVPSCGGILEVLPKDYRLIFSPNQTDDLRRLLGVAAEDREELTELGVACRNSVMPYTWAGYARLLMTLYRE